MLLILAWWKKEESKGNWLMDSIMNVMHSWRGKQMGKRFMFTWEKSKQDISTPTPNENRISTVSF